MEGHVWFNQLTSLYSQSNGRACQVQLQLMECRISLTHPLLDTEPFGGAGLCNVCLFVSDVGVMIQLISTSLGMCNQGRGRYRMPPAHVCLCLLWRCGWLGPQSRSNPALQKCVHVYWGRRRKQRGETIDSMVGTAQR